MFDQVLESFRKASESSLHMQQEFFKQFSQQWMSASPGAVGATGDWGGNMQKRWLELTIELLKKQRDSVATMYASGVKVLEESMRVADAKSADDYRRVVDDISRKLYDSFKDQSEAQVREFQKFVEKSLEILLRGS